MTGNKSDTLARRLARSEAERIRTDGELRKVLAEIRGLKEALQKAEGRQAFVLELSDTLRPLADPSEIQAEACRMLGAYLGVNRVVYAEIDEEDALIRASYTEGVAPLPERLPLAAFGAAFVKANQRNEIIAVDDVSADARLKESERSACREAEIAALAGITLVKEGRWTAAFGLHSTVPRRWAGAELELIREVAERTWAAAERARGEAALRESEARLAVELSDARTLQRLSTRLIPEQQPDALYAQLLDAAMELMKSDAASVQLLEQGENRLKLLASRNLHPDSHAYWEWVEAGSGCACGKALATNTRVIVPDIEIASAVVGTRDMEEYRRSGIRAVQSTPLISRTGQPVGMISTHWHEPQPIDRDFHLLDILARQAADLIERSQAEAALRESEQRVLQFGDASSDVLWIRNARTMCWEYVSPAFDAIYGEAYDFAKAGNDLRGWAKLILPEDRKKALSAFKRVRAGERVTHEFRIRRPSDGAVRWIRNTDFPLFNGAGELVRIGGIGHDATEEKEAADRLRVLVAELQHRTRNLIAVVRSLADKTMAEGSTLDDFRNLFRERLGALSRVQGLLSRLEEGDRVTFDELIHAELSAHGVLDGNGTGTQVQLKGPGGVRLRSGMVQTLALALHELATNALKYGALSTPGGRLAVRWHMKTGSVRPNLHVEWCESGVTASPPPASNGRGYGRELIERALPYQLSAETTYEMRPEGIRCTISLPVSTEPKP